MNYKEQQKARAKALLARVSRDPGQGLFRGKQRDFVLSKPSLNLWAGIRADATEYFSVNDITWWTGDDDGPTGHLLSSQVACLNHLYFLRQRADAATILLKGLEPTIVSAEMVDTGFVEFEFIGSKQYLPEAAFTRGANCTSVDAAMIGRTQKDDRILFLIEWKYTESYASKNLYVVERAKVYDSFIVGKHSPFSLTQPDGFYYEPFYQMMRQTLLGNLCALNRDHGCTDYRLVHVIPAQNLKLLQTITSPKLSGTSIGDAWKQVLKNPGKYLTLSPEKLLDPVSQCPDVKSVLGYLNERYWT